MWVVLTRTDGLPIAVNMDRVTDFRQIGDKTVLTSDVREDSGLKVIRVTEAMDTVVKLIRSAKREVSTYGTRNEPVTSEG